MICPIPKLIVQNSQPDPGRMGHTWDAAQSSIETASVTAGDRPETDLSRSGLETVGFRPAQVRVDHWWP
jgi:hypothetical protein